MLAYIPKFHDRVERALSRAFGGSVAALSDIRSAVVTTLPDAIAPLAQDIAAIDGKVDAIPAHVAQAKVDTLEGVEAKLKATADRIVSELGPQPLPTPPADIDPRLAPALRILVQAQAIALDATPDETVGKSKQLKDNVAIAALSASDAARTAKAVLGAVLGREGLATDFEHALRKFDDSAPACRARRWSEMQQLCAEIAALRIQDDQGNA